MYSALGNDFPYNRGHVFEKRLCFQKSKAERMHKVVHRHKYNEQILSVIFGIQNEDKLFQSQEPNCVPTHTHTHTHTHTALNSLLKTHTGIQYEHKGILQLTNSPQVNPKCLFYQQWPPVMILAPETGLKRTAVIWFHNMQQAHTHSLSHKHTFTPTKFLSLLDSAQPLSMVTNAATVLYCFVIKWRRGVKTPNRLADMT